MSTETITCPNPQCRVTLKLPALPPPGTKVKCPRCGTTFEPAAPSPAQADPGVIALAPEPERHCPECRAVLAPNAVLCVKCGFDLRSGKKLEAPKKAKRKRAARPEGGPVTSADLPEILIEAKKLIGLARKEMWRVPYVLGLGDDPSLAVLMKPGRPGRCVNPNCQLSLGTRGFVPGGRRGGTSKVRITVRGQSLTVECCASCTATVLAELAARDETARAYLDEARQDLEPAAARFPEDPGIQEAMQEFRKVEVLADAKRARARLCFIATAAFGSPLAAEVETLRRFRDEVLARSAVGRLLIRAYETISPPLAAALARSDRGRRAVRRLLRPVAALCRRRLGDEEKTARAGP